MNQIRYARKQITASCLLIHCGRSLVASVDNISATGILLKKDVEEDLSGLVKGDACVLEVVVNQDFNFDVKAQVVRCEGDELAMHFTHIADDKQKDLWQLLGDQVHQIESYL